MKNDKTKIKDTLVVSGPEGKGKIEVEMGTIKRAALTLRALRHPLRKKILELITAKGKISVTELYRQLKAEQSVTSSQLAILRKAHLVNAQRDGQKIFYSVNGKRIREVADLAAELAQELD